MKFLPLSIIAVLVLVTPEQAAAQQAILGDGFCSGTDCSSCDLVLLANNLIKWLIGTVMVLFAVLAVWAGFGLVTSGGNPSAITDAKSKFMNAFIGLLIVLSAWLIVDTLMRGLLGGNGEIEGYGPWSQVKCATQTDTTTEAGFLESVLSESAVPELGSAIVEEPGTFAAYTFDPIQNCQTLVTQSLGDPVACQAALNDLQTITPSMYVYQNCEGNPGSGSRPNWFGARDCAIPPSAAGEVCYQSGNCFQLEPASDHGYPLCGFSVPGLVNYSTANMGAKVSPNFTLGEVLARKSGMTHGYVSPAAVAGLERIRSAFGGPITVSSGFRSPAYNRDLATRNSGVASCSRHMSGLAFDISDRGGKGSARRAQLRRACESAGAGFIKDDYDNHIHCDFR